MTAFAALRSAIHSDHRAPPYFRGFPFRFQELPFSLH